jgi:hypothetical protein
MTFLEYAVDVLRDGGICGKLWIDGSLLTTKIDPEDADLVLLTRGEFADSMTAEQREVEEWFADTGRALKQWLRMHAFTISKWSEGHPNYEFGEWSYAYWLKRVRSAERIFCLAA